VDANGCPRVKVIEQEKPVVKPIEIKKETPLILKGVNFESGKAVLTPESSAMLDEVVASLKANLDVAIEVSGHTDSYGDAESNQRLSQGRASAVREYLLIHGIAAERVTAVGFGETLAIASNQTPEGRAANRRVEIRRTN
jgi:OOP family OmpA-OmpF porin